MVVLAGLVVVIVLLVRTRRELAGLRASVVVAPRSGTRQAAGRAVRAVVDTATRVREHGVTGLLASSLEELARWATEDRKEIARVAAPDGTVAIVFSDIENSTELNERLGDDRWVAALGVHDALVRKQVARHGGHVVKAQGDGFMIVFGEPLDAVRCAMAVQQSLGGERRLRRLEVRVRIGAHVGETVVRDRDYFGRNVAMAARIANAAEGGEVLVSDDLHAALVDASEIEFVPAGELEFKGFTGRHAVWRVMT